MGSVRALPVPAGPGIVRTDLRAGSTILIRSLYESRTYRSPSRTVTSNGCWSLTASPWPSTSPKSKSPDPTIVET
jgi:hypothetical protein